MRTRTTRPVWLVAAMLLGACEPDPEPPPPLDQAIAEAAADRAIATSDAGTAAFERELRYGRADGVAGRAEELRVNTDGDAELTARGREPVTFALDEDELAALASALERVDLSAQPADQMSDPPVPDAITHELVQDGSSVLADEFAVNDELRPVLELLGGLMDAHRGPDG